MSFSARPDAPPSILPTRNTRKGVEIANGNKRRETSCCERRVSGRDIAGDIRKEAREDNAVRTRMSVIK
jgi:hypothetical protein